MCENLEGKAPNGQLRVSACVPLLDQWAAASVVPLPTKRPQSVRGPARLPGSSLGPPEIAVPLAEVRPITVEPLLAGEQAVWDAMVATQHALGFQRGFGAHQRYWIYGQVDGSRVAERSWVRCCLRRRRATWLCAARGWAGAHSSNDRLGLGSSPRVAS